MGCGVGTMQAGHEQGVSKTSEYDIASMQVAGQDGPLAQLVIGPDGWVHESNSRACELLGVATGFRNSPLTAAITVGSALPVLDHVDAVCASGAPAAFEDELWAPVSGGQWLVSGGLVPLRDETGSVVAATLTVDVAGLCTGLQASNEELRRDNSELRTIAAELRTRTDELNAVTAFLQSVLTSLRGAVVVLDTGLTIRVWNAEAQRLWGIKRRVAMQSRLHELDLGFGQECLTPSIEACLRADVSADVQVEVRRPSGDRAAYTVSVTPLLGPGPSVHGVTLLFVDRRPL